MKNCLPERSARAVGAEIARGNEWYVGDQAAAQLATPGSRAVIEHRWRMFDELVRSWIAERGNNRPVCVLDAGCGDGNNLVALRSIVEAVGVAACVFGVDYNELRLARSRERTGTPTLKGDLLNLPFADRTFDLILCNHVIEHIPDDIGALRELARVLKLDGVLLVGVPNEGCALGRLRNHALQRSILKSTDHVHFYTAALLVERVRCAGLRPRAEIRREGFFVPHLRVANLLRESRLGRAVMDALAALFPSQSAGLLLAAVHDQPRSSAVGRTRIGRSAEFQGSLRGCRKSI